MATWTPVVKYVDGAAFGEGYFGYGLFGGGSSWTTVAKKTSTWVQEASSGTIDSIFGYEQPLGGVEWTTVAKD